MQICQLAEMNPDVQFLQVNYEEHKSMCYSLNVHVLPFFRFYRGAEGRLCSFSCTNATVSFPSAFICFRFFFCYSKCTAFLLTMLYAAFFLGSNVFFHLIVLMHLEFFLDGYWISICIFCIIYL